jgi:hypothetical protein
MTAFNLFRRAAFTSTAVLATACSNEPSVGMVINHIGAPPPVSIEVTPGKCGETETIRSDKNELILIRRCGGPTGVIKITVRCPGGVLPEAIIAHNFPNGDSHYVAFHDVCSSTKDEIEKGNAAVNEGTTWRPVKGRRVQ